MRGLGKLLSHGFCFRSEQWGITDEHDNVTAWWHPFPITMGSCYGVNLTRNGGSDGVFVVKIKSYNPSGFYWTDCDLSNNHGSGDNNVFIAIGNK